MFGRWRATRKGDVIEQTLHDPKKLLDLDLLKLLSPSSAFICQIWCQAGLLALSVLLLLNAIVSAKSFGTIGLARFERYDVIIQVDTSRVSQYNSTFQMVTGEIKLLRQGCIILEGVLKQGINGLFSTSGMQLIQVDGFVISNFSRNQSLRGSRLLLRGSNNNGTTWATVGQSADFRIVSSGIRFLDSNLAAATEGSVSYDFRPSWPLFVETWMYSFLFAFGCLGAGTLGMLKRIDAAKRVFLLVGMLCTLNASISGVGFLLLRLPRDSFLPLLHTIIYLLGTLALWRRERIFFTVMVILALVSICGRYVHDCHIYKDCSYLADAPPIWPIFFAALGAAFLLMRSFFLFHSIRSISCDQLEYDTRWREIVTNSEELEALQEVREIAQRLESRCGRTTARQLNRLRGRGSKQRKSWVSTVSGDSLVGWSSVGLAGMNRSRQHPGGRDPLRAGDDEAMDSISRTVAGQLDEQRPVDSLDQLYAQALCAARLLEHKAAAWAAATRGRLGSSNPEPEPLARARARQCPPPTPLERLLPPAGCELVRRGCLKPPSRAVEKAASCYRGDVSRLLDVARARLLFESAAGLAACLELVCDQDPAVRLVRVKDWLHAAHDSDSTAGFRVLSSSDSDVLLRK